MDKNVQYSQNILTLKVKKILTKKAQKYSHNILEQIQSQLLPVVIVAVAGARDGS